MRLPSEVGHVPRNHPHHHSDPAAHLSLSVLASFAELGYVRAASWVLSSLSCSSWCFWVESELRPPTGQRPRTMMQLSLVALPFSRPRRIVKAFEEHTRRAPLDPAGRTPQLSQHVQTMGEGRSSAPSRRDRAAIRLFNSGRQDPQLLPAPSTLPMASTEDSSCASIPFRIVLTPIPRQAQTSAPSSG